jgi:hypothetical protein
MLIIVPRGVAGVFDRPRRDHARGIHEHVDAAKIFDRILDNVRR